MLKNLYKIINVSNYDLFMTLVMKNGTKRHSVIESGRTVGGLKKEIIAKFFSDYIRFGYIIVEEEESVVNWKKEGF